MLNLTSAQMPLFGAELARLAATAKLKRPLWVCAGDEREPMEGRCSWIDGGCLILADAIVEWLPCAELHTVVSDMKGWGPGEQDLLGRHTMAVVGDLGGREWILDAYGASGYGPDYLKDHFSTLPTWILAGRPDPEHMIPEDPEASHAVAGMLARHFPGVRCCAPAGACRPGKLPRARARRR